MPNPGPTRVQRRMLDILDDGELHTVEELHSCLSDELGDVINIRTHICDLRKKLRKKGRDIICERGVNGSSRTYYRQVRHISRDE